MAATHTYVITVGTEPVPEGARAVRRATRHGRVAARHARGVTVVRPAGPRTGRHRAAARHQPAPTAATTRDQPMATAAGTRRPGGAHRSPRIAGRHRFAPGMVRTHRRTRYRAAHGLVLRAAVPVLLLAVATAVFVSAWFGAGGAAFAGIIQP